MAHSHTHEHAPTNFGKAFAIGVTLNISYVVVGVIFGNLAHSLALVADAWHNLGDVLGLLLAWGAGVLARRNPTMRRTYGFRRTSILAALVNAVVLLIAVGGIAWEAVQRIANPTPIADLTVMVVAAIGILVNGLTAWLFMSGQKEDLNIRGAFMHMASDAVLSLGVVIAATVIRFTGWSWLDPAMSLVLVAVITVGTWGLLREATNLALDGVPDGVDAHKVESYLATLPGVNNVHDLHIWGMSTTETALTVHLVKSEARIDDAFLSHVCSTLHDDFGIEHATLQLENGDAECSGCHPFSVQSEVVANHR